MADKMRLTGLSELLLSKVIDNHEPIPNPKRQKHQIEDSPLPTSLEDAIFEIQRLRKQLHQANARWSELFLAIQDRE